MRTTARPWITEAVVISGCVIVFVIALLVVLSPADPARSNGGSTSDRDARSTDPRSLHGPTLHGVSDLGTDSLGRAPVEIHVRAPEAAPDLKNDSSGPLFIETNMAPGTTTTRCVAVTNVGTRAADVRLFGVVEDGGLGPHLAFRIEAGTRGRYGDCADFSGKPIYDGSLARFGAEHGAFATGLVVAKRVDPKTSVSFRLTQRLAESSPQGAHATAGFAWEARSPAVAAPQVARPELPPESQEPAADGAVAPPERGPSLLDTVVKATIEVAKRGWSWIVLLILVFLFLVIQDRIDRRDPRLAGARVYPEPDLTFDDVLGRSRPRAETNA